MTDALKFSRKLLPFEKEILTAVHAHLPSNVARKFAAQIAAINKVQRLLEWHEIEFYSMRWFKAHWPPECLFSQRGETEMARVEAVFGSRSLDVSVWSVNGHLFSLEAKEGMKQLQKQPFIVRETVILPAAIILD